MKNLALILLLLSCHLALIAQNQVPGTVVTAPVVPNDLRDEYPTHIDKYGLGGYRIVATKGERDSIKLSLRKFGMLVNVAKIDSTFRLVQNPNFPGDLSKGLWVHWLPTTNRATYNMVKGPPPEDYVQVYPFKQVRTPIYFRTPFLTDLYYIRVQCYNDRGTVPYLIVTQTPQYFSLDVAEPCICSWEAQSID